MAELHSVQVEILPKNSLFLSGLAGLGLCPGGQVESSGGLGGFGGPELGAGCLCWLCNRRLSWANMRRLAAARAIKLLSVWGMTD